MEHEFGGAWTEEKLDRLRKYLPAYTKIFHKNERAQFLNTVYVDAFAGTGYISRRGKKSNEEQGFFEDFAAPEVQNFIQGSAQIALATEPPFDHYVFVEKDAFRASELERLKVQHRNSGLSIEVVRDDARVFLPTWCSQQNWKKTRAVVFLDPYANQADWAMLQAVAQGKVDLWLLWPIGQVINRLLKKNELPFDSWSDALTRAFGTDEWKEKFYSHPSSTQLDLFSEEGHIKDEDENLIKVANFKQIEQFFIERLKLLFDYVAPNPLYLYNSQNTPLYLLCFASHNATGAGIARDILKP